MSKPAEFPPDKMERQFATFLKACYKHEITNEQRFQLRHAFYAGVVSCFAAMFEASEHPNEDVCEARVELLHREIEARAGEFQLEAVIHQRRN